MRLCSESKLMPVHVKCLMGKRRVCVLDERFARMLKLEWVVDE